MDINYIPQQFSDGQTLKAKHLNHIEEGIKNLEQAIKNLPITSEQVSQEIERNISEKIQKGEIPTIKGEDGKTPEKGVDYFTETDKQEFITKVLNSLPIWNGGAY